MEQGSFEMESLKVEKSQGFRARIVAAVATVVALLIALLAVFLLTVVSRDDGRPAATTACVSAPVGNYPEMPALAPKSAHADDYVHIADAPLAPCPTTPADIFPPDSGIGIVFEHAVFKHCALQVDGPDALCHLAYASGPNLLPAQPANPAVNIEGREYGNCRFDGPLTNSRMSGAGREDQVSDLLRCFLLPMN